MKQALLPLLLSVLLASCASLTPYQPADSRGYGYTEQRLESNRFRISYLANAATDPSAVEDYLLLRAAEMTVYNDYQWFVIALKSQGREPDSREPRLGIGIGVGSGGGGSGMSIGLGGDVLGGGQDYRAQADVVMFSGDKPADRSDAYDAAQLITQLGGQVARPASPAAGK